MKLIEFCASNAKHGTDEVVRRLEARGDAITLEYGCLGHCELCLLEPYVLVEGEYVGAASAEELHEKVAELLDAGDVDPFADLPLD